MIELSSRYMVCLGMAAVVVLSSTGCQELPGSPGTQGAAIGGVGGAAAGAVVGGEHHRLLGALVGGAIGAGGGYLIGANKDRILGQDRAGAETAVRNAQAHPATPQEALNASTADLNNDGFVTMDEVVAMRQAGFSDQQILTRMQATGQVFEFTPEQQAYLRNNGVDQYVIDQAPQLNRQTRDALSNQPATPVPSPTGPPVYRQDNYPQNQYPQPGYPQNNYPQGTYPQNGYPQPAPGQIPPQPAPDQGLNTPVPPPPGP